MGSVHIEFDLYFKNLKSEDILNLPKIIIIGTINKAFEIGNDENTGVVNFNITKNT